MLDAPLQEIARRTAGFRGAAIMATDGILLTRQAAEEGPDLDLFAAECSALLKSLAALTSQQQCGGLRSFSSAGERWRLLLERITKEYFLLLVVTPESPLGECRYRLRRAALELQVELA